MSSFHLPSNNLGITLRLQLQCFQLQIEANLILPDICYMKLYSNQEEQQSHQAMAVEPEGAAWKLPCICIGSEWKSIWQGCLDQIAAKPKKLILKTNDACGY